MNYLILNCLMYAVLAWYADEVVPGAVGVKRSICFCTSSTYWCGKKKTTSKNTNNDMQERKERREKALNETMYVPSTDADIQTEANLVRNRNMNVNGSNGSNGSNGYNDGVDGEDGVAMELLNIKKSFGNFLAVDGLHLSVEKGSLLCLLGHNGAGKTTTINMLTGMLPITSGDATIYGTSCAHDMDDIRSIMGICPQHDILWAQLTGLEHVVLFAGLRGVPPNQIMSEAKKRLMEVELWKVKDVQSGAYSGGMRRRLSMAIALIGDPKVVFLDEPTTGMDPVTRRSVWDMIETCKCKNCKSEGAVREWSTVV